jgi:hypothetical protein
MHGLTNPKLTALSNALNCVFILSCNSYSRTSLAPHVSVTDHPVGIQQLQNITAEWTGWPWPSSQTDVFSSILFWTSRMSLQFCVTQLHSIIKAGSPLNTQNVPTSSYYINKFNETVEGSFDIIAVTYRVRQPLNIRQVVLQTYTVSWHQKNCSWKISKNAVSQTVSTPSMSEKS